jgi:hypothetical protein
MVGSFTWENVEMYKKLTQSTFQTIHSQSVKTPCRIKKFHLLTTLYMPLLAKTRNLASYLSCCHCNKKYQKSHSIIYGQKLKTKTVAAVKIEECKMESVPPHRPLLHRYHQNCTVFNPYLGYGTLLRVTQQISGFQHPPKGDDAQLFGWHFLSGPWEY